MINTDRLHKIKLKKIGKSPIAPTIDEDLVKALREISKDVPFSYATEHVLTEGFYFYVEEKRRLTEQLENHKKIKLNATINKNLLENLQKLSKELKVPFSVTVNYILRLGFEELIKEQEEKNERRKI